MRTSPSPVVLVAGLACAAIVGCVVSQNAPSLQSRMASRTRVNAEQGFLGLFKASAGKPRAAKPAYNKAVSQAPLRQVQPWVGTWVDPVTMFSKKADFGRAGKPKSTVKVTSGKVAAPVKKLAKKSWTGGLGSHYEKLIAKGQPKQAISMEKAASTSTLRTQQPWIGSAAYALFQGTADAMEYVDKPQPKKKMWITSGDPNGPWKAAEKALPAAAAATTTVADAVAEPAKAAEAKPVEKVAATA